MDSTHNSCSKEDQNIKGQQSAAQTPKHGVEKPKHDQAGNRQDKQGGQRLAPAERFGVPPQHTQLPIPIAPVLASKCGKIGTGKILGADARVKPDHPPRLANPHIKLIVLVTQEGFIIGANSIHQGAVVGSKWDRINNSRYACIAIACISDPQAMRGSRRN